LQKAGRGGKGQSVEKTQTGRPPGPRDAWNVVGVAGNFPQGGEKMDLKTPQKRKSRAKKKAR